MRLKFKMPLTQMLKRQRRWEKALATAVKASRSAMALVPIASAVLPKRVSVEKLEEVAAFGANPGRLRMLRYVPPSLPKRAPLVVVLHGCKQTAEDYDRGAGWSTLARERGFAVVYAEQTRSNNPNRCFNWFRPSSVTRDRGEVMSVRQMIAKMAAAHGIDKRRVYITGLSAGGAMTAAMLATYPDVFAGGAIIAGLPYGAARDVRRALEAMRQPPERAPQEWADLVRAAAPAGKRWPSVSIWHGTKDTTVSIDNAHALLAQWLTLHGLDAAAFDETLVDGHIRRVWRDKTGVALVEFFIIEGMGHGTPLKPRPASRTRADTPGPFMLDAGISSSMHLATGWGLKKPSLIAALKPKGP